ncbi:MAG: 30S ribosomal protein S3 [Parcubacteria group bacterium Gr01-1014_20]|nr:MAG: 30S ribosomal protein S3 [Parcubacteria group bacterium Gr01-1014_20]
MGQKINPHSLRLGVTKNWPVRWFFSGRFKEFLEEDEAIRKVIKDKISQAGIVSVEIERTSNNLKVMIRAARPGFVIGRGGKGIEDLTKAIEKALMGIRKTKEKTALSVNVEELKRSEVSAIYTAEQIAWDLEKRLPFRRTMKKYIDQVMQSREAKGIKVMLSGRLGGAEIARREHLKAGMLPLQTLRADIDYGQATAFTAFGTIGIKVWIYKGDIFEEKKKEKDSKNK